MKRAVGYVRVSTKIQATHGESLRIQKKEIRKYIKREKWKLVKIYADEGVSGSSVENRLGFQDLMEDAKKRKFDVIVIHKLSRFARNAMDLLNKVDELKKFKIELVSIKEKIDLSNHYGVFMLTMLGAVAQLERDVIFEQMSENKLARWQQNKIFVGKAPFGYYWDKKTKRIEINQEEAKIYRRIVDMYIGLGLSFKDIVARLKDEGVKCKNAPFSSAVISYILKNPAYYNNYYVNTRVYKGSRRTKEKKPAAEHIKFDLDPLISKGKWDKIQKRTAFNKIKSKRSDAAKSYWLRDLLECGECGGRIKPRHGSKRKDGSFPRYYSCYWRQASKRDLKTHEKTRCDLPFIKADDLEDRIWYQIFSQLSMAGRGKKTDIEKVFDLKLYDKQIDDLKVKIDRFENDLRKKERAKKRIYSMLDEDGFSKDEFLGKARETEDKIISIKGRLTETKDQIETIKEARASNSLLKRFLKNKRALIDKVYRDLVALSPEDKKQLVESMLEDNIRIGIDFEGSIGWADLPYRIMFNPLIFEELMNQGKVFSLDQNGPHHPAAHQL